MDWMKKHADTVAILSGILVAFVWMNNSIAHLDQKITSMEKDLAIVKTVLLMKDIMPKELCKVQCEVEKNVN